MRALREAAVLLAIAIACSTVAYFGHPKAPSFHVDDLERELGEILEMSPVLWVDARSDEEYQSGHYEDSISLNGENWESLFIGFLDRWLPDQATVVYCSSQSCLRSHEVARRLKEELDIEEFYVLRGGWETLMEANLVGGPEK